MSANRTFTMIKPDAVEKEFGGAILKQIQESGFKIIAMKQARLTPAQAAKFYFIHRERPFYKDLCDFMCSGTIIPAILEKENAVEDFRKLIGATNPANAEAGTIRKLYAESIDKNAVHGSDSDENAIIEGNFFFSELEKF